MTLAAQPTVKAHNLPLDSVRGIAALCIVVHHCVISQTFGRVFDLGGPLAGFFWNAWIFVDLFFVLSGIVIAMNYAAPRGPFSIREFMVRRLARIYPLHLAMLLVLLPLRGVRLATTAAGLPVASGLTQDVNTPYAFVMQLFLLNALGTVDSLNWNGPSWSISAEFYTYLIFAGLIAALAAHRALALTGPVFALLSVAALLAILFVLRADSLEFHFDFGILRCLYSFAIGVVTFKLVEALGKHLAWAGDGRVQGLAALAALALVAAVGAHGALSFLAPPVFALFLGGLLVNGGSGLGRLLSARPLIWLGARSYSIYMVHATVVVLAEYGLRAVGLDRIRALDAAFGGYLGLALILAVVGSVLIIADFTRKHVEKPGSRAILALFDRSRFARRAPALDLQERP
ncbi:acyltransferase [Methylobacterium sp. NEAU 140]|uniref:acyltransferase family protein n=1 Tax=Methylobacterium sp. NEAU 140 TaxID=3064945 RepID=UPI0027339CAE|nr:acyltransferase [Methylobacterium sp. NEAU 140]MDP4021788.1 acyltransferase [Methylobacterium sp. NEAU 140]